MPSEEQQRDMRRFAGSCRFVDNKALALQNANHEAGNKFIGLEMVNLLPEWKYEFDWLRASPSQALQHALKHLDQAFTNFFDKRAEYPRFKNADKGTASASRKDSNSIRKTAEFSFRNWAGSATAHCSNPSFGARDRSLFEQIFCGVLIIPTQYRDLDSTYLLIVHKELLNLCQHCGREIG
jgi:hypothetical protein